MNILRTFFTKWGMLFAFVLLAGVGMYAVNAQANANAQTLYRTQLAGCKQANSIRTESNQRIAAHVLNRDVLAKFLNSAAYAREASGSPTDVKAAKEYRALRDSLSNVHFKKQPLLDCAKAVNTP
jgi:hypothetical protein